MRAVAIAVELTLNARIAIMSHHFQCYAYAAEVWVTLLTIAAGETYRVMSFLYSNLPAHFEGTRQCHRLYRNAAAVAEQMNFRHHSDYERELSLQEFEVVSQVFVEFVLRALVHRQRTESPMNRRGFD